MKKLFGLLFFLLLFNAVKAQQIDTLTFLSQIYKDERQVFVVKPQWYDFQSDSIRLPVIYILDAQHEWFVNPMLSSITYLQYCHQMPQALLVLIPHQDRNMACDFRIEQNQNPLLNFITKEVSVQIEKYRPSAYKMLVGHSLSASFALYAFLKEEAHFQAVFAHTPLAELSRLFTELAKQNPQRHQNIYLSFGSAQDGKDNFHRNAFEQIAPKFSTFLEKTTVFRADYASHNALPIVANPLLFTKHFNDFSKRFSHIAAVDLNYQLVAPPCALETLMPSIYHASKLGTMDYWPEIAEINGIASRFWNSGALAHVEQLYLWAISLYPYYYEFYLFLYEIIQEKDLQKAKSYLFKAKELLETKGKYLPERAEVLVEIEAEIQKQGW